MTKMLLLTVLIVPVMSGALVLSATRPPRSNDPIAVKLQPIILEMQRDLASRSSKSAHVLLPNSGHLVPRDEPQAIVEAVKKVLEWR